MGGFVHGIVNGVQASLRNVGHKSAQSVPANGYHSDHPPPSKGAIFKNRTPQAQPATNSPESPASAESSRDHSSASRPFNKVLARSQSRSRAYESDGDNHTIASIRHSRPGFPPISTNASTPTERFAKANGHTHVPLSPLSRDASQPQSISAVATALGQASHSQSPSTPSTHPITYSIQGPVPRNAARAILELDAIPPADLLKVLAALLEQIATANDSLRPKGSAITDDIWSSRFPPGFGQETEPKLPPSPESPPSTSPTKSRSRSQRRASTETDASTPIWNQLTTASRVALSSRTATLSFHARHVPQISLEAYLLRILKYCPTANATFVAVLVYLDRMCRMAMDIDGERHTSSNKPHSPLSNVGSDASATDMGISHASTSPVISTKPRSPFVIDSYNIHRLVIAGVTVASKFFSDVFYTNSRYAKVGGLPQGELNQLELQFLLLNDFDLVVPPEELARYAAQLIAYGQSKGHTLVPEGLGKGKIGIEAKIVLGLEPERLSESVQHSPASLGYINGYNTSHYPMDSTSSMNYAGRPMSGRGGYYGTDTSSQHNAPGYYHDNRSSSDIADSETEVSTDEDSTIRARSGSESEASEWGVDSSTGDEGDGAETETEGDDDDDDEDVVGHRVHRFTRSATVDGGNSNSSGTRMGRLRDVHSSAGLHHPER